MERFGGNPSLTIKLREIVGHCPKVIFMYAIQGGRHNRIPANRLIISEFSHRI